MAEYEIKLKEALLSYLLSGGKPSSVRMEVHPGIWDSERNPEGQPQCCRKWMRSMRSTPTGGSPGLSPLG